MSGAIDHAAVPAKHSKRLRRGDAVEHKKLAEAVSVGQ